MIANNHARAVFAIAFAAIAVSPRARAESGSSDSATAQALFDRAKKLMANGQYAEACPKLEESQRLDAGSGTLLNLADCYEHEGKLASAWAKFLEAAAVAKTSGNPARERVARERAATVLSRVSNIVIDVGKADTPPGFEVKRDGASVGRAQWGTPTPADPGQHMVTASAPGRRSWETTVTVGASSRTYTVAIPPLEVATGPTGVAAAIAPSTKPEVSTTSASPIEGGGESATGLGTQRVLAVGVGVVAVAGLAVGTVYGLKSKSKHDEAALTCNPGCDGGSGLQLKDEAKSAGNVSTIGFILGVTGVAGAAVLWLTAPSASRNDRAVQVGWSPRGVVVEGRF